MDLLSAYGALFGSETALPFAQIASGLQQQGFANQTILINLTWLVEGGYAALELKDGTPVIRRLLS
jgi:hypothetical protein